MYINGGKLCHYDWLKVTINLLRKPVIPVMRLSNHKDCVNAVAWAPQSAVHMCTVGDDCKAYIWDLTASGNRS